MSDIHNDYVAKAQMIFNENPKTIPNGRARNLLYYIQQISGQIQKTEGYAMAEVWEQFGMRLVDYKLSGEDVSELARKELLDTFLTLPRPKRS